MKIKKLLFIFFPLLGLSYLSLLNKNEIQNINKPNIIFISVDDLRPQLNCYGKNQIISPNIDDLASNLIHMKMLCVTFQFVVHQEPLFLQVLDQIEIDLRATIQG